VSICLSVTGQGSTKTAKPKITQTMPYDSPVTLQKILAKFQWGHAMSVIIYTVSTSFFYFKEI